MPIIVRDLPFFDRPTTIEVRGHSVTVKRDQIIVWISIAEKGVASVHPNTPRLPAILDTGCNHGLVIRQRHLVGWAGIHSEYLRRLTPIRLYGKPLPQLAANVWLYRNRRGERDKFSGRQPFLLEIVPGIAVVPEGEDRSGPRLPLLGLRALRWNHLRIAIDCDRCCVTIHTRRRFWLFG